MYNITRYMNIFNRRETVALLAGDILVFAAGLWLTLFFRYAEIPSRQLIYEHLFPFLFLFALWVLVFFVAGLYEKQTVILRHRLPHLLFNTLLVNSVLAVVFFYFLPVFQITPKGSLFLYLAISFLLMLLWRIYGSVFLSPWKREKAILIGQGEELHELLNEVNNNWNYNISFVSSVDAKDLPHMDFKEEIVKRIYSDEIYLIAVDLKSDAVEPLLPHLYNLIFSGVRFIDMHKIYEEIFNRIPLSLVRADWFLENISATPARTYDALKRIMDIAITVVLGAASLAIYPFVFVLIYIEDGRPFFIIQERIGKRGKRIKTLKFRSMRVASGGGPGEITRVGKFLRKTRIDELPQLWNVLRGDLSLIGPRPELPELVKLYEKEIPFYNIRHLIKPGLSGWAQLYHENHPHYRANVSETKVKLSYDLFYIKNRSLFLDLKIALKTIKVLLSRSGV
jgi:exopolysaccharide biosynthesis polyprenyl glycosylphosphotransferase